MSRGSERGSRNVLIGFDVEASPGLRVDVEVRRELATLCDRLFVQSSSALFFVLEEITLDHVELPGLARVPCEWFSFGAGTDGAPGQPVPFPALHVGQLLTLGFRNVDTVSHRLRGVLAGNEIFSMRPPEAQR